MKRLFLFSAMMLGFLAPLSAQDSDFAKKVDEYVLQVMDTWQLPGAAVAISVDNKVVFKKAYGVKELRPADGVGFAGVKYDECKFAQAGVKPVVNKPGDPVNTSSLFQIASVSKSFTATVMAQLVDEGKFKWTDTVKKLLPDFRMFPGDDYVTNNMLVRDALLHSTGLVNEAGTYFGNLGYDRDETYTMLGLLKPGFSFRSAYDYNNITFVVCSKLIEKYTGKSWEENVRERVFKPLGMTSSTMNADGFAAAKDVVTPHDWTYSGDGKATVLPLYGDEQALNWLTVIGPAGSLCSTVEDLIRYAQFHCNNGYIVNRDGEGNVVDTTFIMPRKAMLPLHRGYTVTSQDSTMMRLYGMCWFIEQNNRYKLYFHTGTSWGVTAICYFVPELKLAGCVLLNCEVGANPRYAIMRRVIDLVRGEKEPLRDYSTEYWKDYTSYRDKVIAEQKAKPKPDVFPEVANPGIFAGTYTKEAPFGDIIITYEKGKLYRIPAKFKGVKEWKKELKHKSGTTYVFRSDGHGFELTFNMEDGKVTGFDQEFGEGEEKAFGGWTRK
ncbi:MAG: serine hydrolase [Bacteroidales bacterium]|nr:serine hydrolase [Bacteroidales bacterium]